MRNKLRLIVNNNFDKGESFFIKKELRSILNLYAKKVSSGERFRLSVSRSAKNISAQIIDDNNNITVLSSSSKKNQLNH